MLTQLNRERLKVQLFDAPYKKFDGHKIRVAISSNPDWYRKLYKDYPYLKRDRVVTALTKLIINPCRENRLESALRDIALDVLYKDGDMKREDYPRMLVKDSDDHDMSWEDLVVEVTNEDDLPF